MRNIARIIVSTSPRLAGAGEDGFLWTEPSPTVTFGTKYPMRSLKLAAHQHSNERFLHVAPVDLPRTKDFDGSCGPSGARIFMAHTLR